MNNFKAEWKRILAETIAELATEAGTKIDHPADSIVVEQPPKPEMGDVAFPMFPFARIFKTAPPAIAVRVKERLDALSYLPGKAVVAGPYVNVFIDRSAVIRSVLAGSGSSTRPLAGRKIMIEFSCPNTNKPLHLGHLRNDAIGESLSRILAAAGAEVMKVNLINDRGIHICKSMLAYREFGEGTTPESEGIKGDHFVGKYYVKYNDWSKTDETAEQKAREMLVAWEQGDAEVNDLWKTMNRWTIDGVEATYQRTGISFDKVYFESETYLKGKDQVLEGLERGIFFKKEDGSVWVDLSNIDLDQKVLLRGDGTSLYLTQDLGTAISRHGDFPFDQLIYVVGSEQQYHFQVLFHVLGLLGFDWASSLYHLSYGMVNLPEGKMKSREGTVVDADDLIDQLTEMAENEIKSKGREEQVGNVSATAESIALGALHYFLLQATPSKDMVFDPRESLSFNGNTGPYLQYMGARISSMLRKFESQADSFNGIKADPSLLVAEEEWELVKLLARKDDAVAKAAEEMSCAVVAGYLYDLCKAFSRFYHECVIVDARKPELTVSRVELSRKVLEVLKQGLYLINVPFLETM